MVKYKQPK